MKYFFPPYDEISLKKQYKHWAKKLHPDMPDGSEKLFNEMKAEFDSLQPKEVAFTPDMTVKESFDIIKNMSKQDEEALKKIVKECAKVLSQLFSKK